MDLIHKCNKFEKQIDNDAIYLQVHFLRKVYVCICRRKGPVFGALFFCVFNALATEYHLKFQKSKREIMFRVAEKRLKIQTLAVTIGNRCSRNASILQYPTAGVRFHGLVFVR